MRDNVILIGFMGAGKTSVGKALSESAGMALADTDCMIETEAGMSVSDIFASRGETFFREMETAILKSLLDKAERTIICAGGGLPLREENRDLIRRLGTVAYLRVKPETVLSRLKGDTTRPLLKGGDAQEKVHGLLKLREPIYAQAAHRTIDVDGKTPRQIAYELRAALKL